MASLPGVHKGRTASDQIARDGPELAAGRCAHLIRIALMAPIEDFRKFCEFESVLHTAKLHDFHVRSASDHVRVTFCSKRRNFVDFGAFSMFFASMA